MDEKQQSGSLFATGKTRRTTASVLKSLHSLAHIPMYANSTVPVQAKLAVDRQGDKYEQEADTIAHKIMSDSGSVSIQRKCAKCEEEEEEKQLQRKPGPGKTGITVSPSLSNKISLSKGLGQNMDNATRSFMTARFGFDFSSVKIHTDHEAVKMNRELNAKAFTVGNDIYFNHNHYEPRSAEGKHLLAHELVHTIQQSDGIRRKPMPEDRFGRPLGFFPTPEQEAYDRESFEIRENLFKILRDGFPNTKGNTYLLKVIEDKYDKTSDDYWLAMNLLNYGPETLWPAALYAELQAKSTKNNWDFAEGPLGTTAGNRKIDSFYFPGQTDNRALIIGGVHGTELSGTEVVQILIDKLKKGPKPYYTVILVPSLFPDNAAVAASQPAKIETGENVGRYTKGTEFTSHSTDPNRQFPAFGKGYDPKSQKDAKGRIIEPENILLLELIDRFRPARIASVHSNHDLDKAGIYADPRTDSKGIALGYDSDKDLALTMADAANTKGANVPGNKFSGGKASNAVYPLDPAVVAAGKKQPRDTKKGTSLGGWGSTAVCDPANPAANRPAMRIITVEVHLAHRSTDVAAADQAKRKAELEALADVLKDIFLGPNQVEGKAIPCPAP